MAVDYFLKLDGIEGESTDEKHKKEIQIDTFSWGVSNHGTMGRGGGGGSGKAEFSDISFTKWGDTSSPLLVKAAASGEHIASAVFTARKQGGKAGQQDFMVVTLSDVMVSSYTTSGHGGADSIPQDSFSLNFTKIEYKYMEQKADGSLGGNKVAKYDRALNKAG